MKKVIFTLKLVFADTFYIFLFLSLSLNLLLIYYLIFLKTTTLSLLFSTTNSFYAWSSVVLTILISLFFGISLSLFIYQQRQVLKTKPLAGKSLLGVFFGALSMGCPVCGSLLLPILGVAGGLSVFPFQGLELKIAAILLFGFSIYESSKIISEKICPPKEKIIKFEKGKLVLNFNKNALFSLVYFLLPLLILAFVISLPFWPAQYKFNLAKKDQTTLTSAQETPSNQETFSNQDLLKKINPPSGYQINAIYSDIGPKLLEVGAIDLEKMKKIYERAGSPLTEEQIKILTQGSNEKIKITPENSYFLLNFLWALGLANKNSILDEGPMAKYGGKDGIGNFASTGGWTLGKKKATELYSNFEIIKLNPEQQKTLEDFAFNSYRPCCSNPTGFPDCNHGMAALALGEIMAANGATADEIFEAFKYFNAFWFPQVYFDIAKYFQAKEGKDWSEVDSRLVSGKDFSTPQGWQRAKQWLAANNLLEQAPSAGGGCGI